MERNGYPDNEQTPKDERRAEQIAHAVERTERGRRRILRYYSALLVVPVVIGAAVIWSALREKPSALTPRVETVLVYDTVTVRLAPPVVQRVFVVDTVKLSTWRGGVGVDTVVRRDTVWLLDELARLDASGLDRVQAEIDKRRQILARRPRQ